MTWEAPALIQLEAFETFMPPPICKPPGQALSASSAASSFPFPSLMMWPPHRLSRRYFLENQAGGFSDIKLVRSELGWLSFIELPTICFTLPLCRSMHGLNTCLFYL